MTHRTTTATVHDTMHLRNVVTDKARHGSCVESDFIYVNLETGKNWPMVWSQTVESGKSKWALGFGCVCLRSVQVESLWASLVDENSSGRTVLTGGLFFKIISIEIRARIIKLNGWFTVGGLSKINPERDTNQGVLTVLGNYHCFKVWKRDSRSLGEPP